MFWNSRQAIITRLEGSGLSALYQDREYADEGGLMAYGPNVPDNFRRAAGYVILKRFETWVMPVYVRGRLRPQHTLGSRRSFHRCPRGSFDRSGLRRLSAIAALACPLGSATGNRSCSTPGAGTALTG